MAKHFIPNREDGFYHVAKINAHTRVRFEADAGWYEYGELDLLVAEEPERSDQMAKLESGEYLMLGATVEHKLSGEWHGADSMWGIIVTRTEDLQPIADGMDTDRRAWLESHRKGLLNGKRAFLADHEKRMRAVDAALGKGKLRPVKA